MTLYVDSSALLKRYLDEPDSDRWNELLSSDAAWLTSRLTWVEVWRHLGRRLPPEVVATARSAFRIDWERFLVVEIDAALAEEAASIADLTGARSLDAVHLAALSRSGPGQIPLLTADLRQAQAARAFGWTVLAG
ncbi:MAG: type II toxin-antitoxin system VapC family toxin [Actinomycetota bacterium]|nr:type II toxin-antitoxin system VapC family toxin [Actinomycetota bacterium]